MALSLNAPAAGETLANEQVYQALGQKVALALMDGGTAGARTKIGPLSCNYFSFTFNIRVEAPLGTRHVFVKIPKVDLRGIDPEILPITPEDRQMAREEADSLRLLGAQWPVYDFGVNWVRLCGEFPEYNAIVTERVFGQEAFAVFRRLDVRRRCGFRPDSKRLQGLLARLGGALGQFHQANIRTADFGLSAELPKTERYCRKMMPLTKSALPEKIRETLRKLTDYAVTGFEVPTIKGLDIRNVLMDGQDRFYLLDPGRVKTAPREADLARFLATYRLLHWGSLKQPFLKMPRYNDETGFIRAYSAGVQRIDSRTLTLYLIKELVKHWYNIHVTVQRRRWQTGHKQLAIRFYVDPFFSSLLKQELNNLRHCFDYYR